VLEKLDGLESKDNFFCAEEVKTVRADFVLTITSYTNRGGLVELSLHHQNHNAIVAYMYLLVSANVFLNFDRERDLFLQQPLYFVLQTPVI
jgi:uncharacterized protein (DUF1919 family)